MLRRALLISGALVLGSGCANVGTSTDGAGGAGGKASSGPSGSCGAFQDDSSPGTLTLRFINQRAEPIYVGTLVDCRPGPAFTVDQSTRLVTDAPSCETCEDYKDGSLSQCSKECASFPLVRIKPGASWDFAYDALHFDSAQMPETCYDDPSSAIASCRVRRAISEVRTTLRADVYIEQQCKIPGGTACVCDSGDADSCDVSSYEITGSAVELVTEIEWPTENIAVLTAQ